MEAEPTVDIDALKSRWCGSMVRTERCVSREECREWGIHDEDWFPGYRFDGEGIVVSFTERDGKCWVLIDEGIEWVVDDQTVIQPVTLNYLNRS